MTSNRLISIFLLMVAESSLADYYWRDYNGTIPNDAFRGGEDAHGSSTYIGTSYFEEYGLLPTIIYKGSSYAYGTADERIVRTKFNTKILCSKGETLKWTQTNIYSMDDLHCDIVAGGYEECPLYIGRISFNKQVITGKVYCNQCDENRGLHIHIKPEIGYKYFELLLNC